MAPVILSFDLVEPADEDVGFVNYLVGSTNEFLAALV
jgi:hypothetical protein